MLQCILGRAHPVNRQTPVKTLPCCNLWVRGVKMVHLLENIFVILPLLPYTPKFGYSEEIQTRDFFVRIYSTFRRCQKARHRQNLTRSSYNIPLTSLIKMLKFCLQGEGLKGKRVATLTEIENRNATTSETVTSSRMVYGLARHIITVVFM